MFPYGTVELMDMASKAKRIRLKGFGKLNNSLLLLKLKVEYDY